MTFSWAANDSARARLAEPRPIAARKERRDPSLRKRGWAAVGTLRFWLDFIGRENVARRLIVKPEDGDTFCWPSFWWCWRSFRSSSLDNDLLDDSPALDPPN